ncbi:hypothetical protein CWS02_13985 [Enterobacter sp. EA-1]|nr:hypothetical protein CWS02_13985 [Enterobacter sp. EA-1]
MITYNSSVLPTSPFFYSPAHNFCYRSHPTDHSGDLNASANGNTNDTDDVKQDRVNIHFIFRVSFVIINFPIKGQYRECNFCNTEGCKVMFYGRRLYFLT